jgi:EamA-like transporter family
VALRPNVVAITIADACAITASGVLYMGAPFCYLQALKVEEASVVAPFFRAAPLFGYALSHVVLGERLTLRQDFGGLMITGGTALLSIRVDKPQIMMKLRLVALTLTCALATSVASLIFKIFAIAAEFWTATFWSFVGQVGFGTGLLASAASRKQLGNLIRSGAGRVLGISGVNELVNLTGTLGARYALLLAPLGLVQAVASTTSPFVFLFGVVLSIVAPGCRRGI